MMRTLRRQPEAVRRHRRTAAVTVEVAVVLPIFCMIVGGAVEVGHVVGIQHVLEESAMNGCREAILPGATVADVNDAIDEIVAPWNVSGYTVNISPANPSTALPLSAVTVHVSVPYSKIRWFYDPMMGKSLTGRCLMVTEN
jgi:hypothetical protein